MAAAAPAAVDVAAMCACADVLRERRDDADAVTRSFDELRSHLKLPAAAARAALLAIDGGVAAIVAALRAHVADVAVQRNGLATLQAAVGHPIDVPVAAAWEAAGTVEVVFAVLAAHAGDAHVRALGCASLCALSRHADSVLRTAACYAKLLQSAKAGLTDYTSTRQPSLVTVSNVRALCVGLLQYSEAGCDDMRAAAACLVPQLVALVRQPATECNMPAATNVSKSITMHACGALSHLSRNAGVAGALVTHPDAVSALVAVLRVEEEPAGFAALLWHNSASFLDGLLQNHALAALGQMISAVPAHLGGGAGGGNSGVASRLCAAGAPEAVMRLLRLHCTDKRYDLTHNAITLLGKLCETGFAHAVSEAGAGTIGVDPTCLTCAAHEGRRLLMNRLKITVQHCMQAEDEAAAAQRVARLLVKPRRKHKKKARGAAKAEVEEEEEDEADVDAAPPGGGEAPAEATEAADVGAIAAAAAEAAEAAAAAAGAPAAMAVDGDAAMATPQPSAAAERRRRRAAAKAAQRAGCGAGQSAALAPAAIAQADAGDDDEAAAAAQQGGDADALPAPAQADADAEAEAQDDSEQLIQHAFPFLHIAAAQPQAIVAPAAPHAAALAPPAAAAAAVPAAVPAPPPLPAAPDDVLAAAAAQAAAFEALLAQTTCAVCLDAPRTTVLLPCRHLVLCGAPSCAAMLGTPPLCPLCRVAVADTMQVFM
jgi:hypothetical protein